MSTTAPAAGHVPHTVLSKLSAKKPKPTFKEEMYNEAMRWTNKAMKAGQGIYDTGTRWAGYTVKAGLVTGAAVLATHALYRMCLTPSRPDLNAAAKWYDKFSSDCDTRQFRLLQMYFKVFETATVLPKCLGFHANLPPGDIQAFALLNKLDVLKRVYNETSAPLNQAQKNKLFGKVMEQISFHQKPLVDVARWLLSIGADPNYAPQIDFVKGSMFPTRTLEPLIVALGSNDADFYEDLIQREANPNKNVISGNTQTSRSSSDPLNINMDEVEGPLISVLVKGVASDFAFFATRSAALAEQKPKCGFYKKVVDLAIQAMPEKNSLGDRTADQLKELFYPIIGKTQNYKCHIEFSLPKNNTESNANDKHSKIDPDEELVFLDKMKVVLNVMSRGIEDFKKLDNSQQNSQGQPNAGEIENAYRILKLSQYVSYEEVEERCSKPDITSYRALSKACDYLKDRPYQVLNLPKSSSFQEVKDHCNEQKSQLHPDKGGTDDALFHRVIEACRYLEKKTKGKR